MNERRSSQLLKRLSRAKDNHYERKLLYRTRSRELIKSLSSIKTSMIGESSSKPLPDTYKEALKIYSKEKKSRLFGSSTSFYKGIKFNKRCSSSKKKQLRNIVSFNEMNLFRDSNSSLLGFAKPVKINAMKARVRKRE